MDARACAACGCLYAAGAPCCPECRSTEREGDGVPKITRENGPSYEPGHEPAGWREHPGYGEPMTGAGHPADGTFSPPVSNEDGEEVRAAVTVIPPEGEPPDPAPGPGPGQDSTPPQDSPPSSGPRPAPARAPKRADDG